MGKFTLLIVAALLLAPLSVSGAEIDLRPQWDETIPLANPHKGWYHHFFDNTVDKYLVESDAELTKFPGLDHVYLRLAWAYLEPAEGRFQWSVVDEPIAKWTAQGLGIAFRISCKETSTNRVEQQFATPRWVQDAGARGGHYRRGKAEGPEAPWEPVYDDPVFLAKLEQFLAAFAARYDGQPWLRYVDIGSVGDWGEGHTSSGSGLRYGYAALERHVDLHLKYFRQTPLVISDDFVYSLASPDDRRRLHAKLLAAGVSYRDDSILVDWYVRTCSPSFTVRSPEFFADAWQKTPTVLELEHYGIVKRLGNWTPQPGSSLEKFGAGRRGADYLRGALEQLRATYIGYHGYAREWLADNPELTIELLNRCGYWFFPHTVEIPAVLAAGQPHKVAVSWQNRGVARAYHPYDLLLRLEGSETCDREFPSGNTRWLPGPAEKPWREMYALEIPATLTPGDYDLKLKLRARDAARDVRLPLKANLLDRAGFYTMGRVRVAGARRTEQSRDPWLWPFAADSIWNMPIGSSAVYKPAGLQPAKHVGVDTQILLRTTAADPEREVLKSPSFKSRVGTEPLGFRLRVPDDWTVPDAGPGNPYGLTPNACYAILLPDGINVLQGTCLCRPLPGGPIHLPGWTARPGNRQPISLTGDGLGKIGQGASGLSTLGGTLRKGELVGHERIRHVIKLNPYAARFCFYSPDIPGWRWPAHKADSYAAHEYKGTNPAVVMGSLLALKPDATPEQLGIQTAPGRKLFHVLQDYGTYFAEDAHWDTWDLVAERDAEKEFEHAYGFTMKSETWRDEVNRLVSDLHVIDNNGPQSIGGGGEPRQPLAPPLAQEQKEQAK